MNRHTASGFTLIELMIVVAVIGLLSAIGYPSYTSYIERGKRTEGKAYLMDTAARMERYYSRCSKYPTAAGTAAQAADCANNQIAVPTSSESAYYTLAIASPGNQQTFTITADPATTDTDCDNLTLTQAGVKTENGTKDVNFCWGK